MAKTSSIKESFYYLWHRGNQYWALPLQFCKISLLPPSHAYGSTSNQNGENNFVGKEKYLFSQVVNSSTKKQALIGINVLITIYLKWFSPLSLVPYKCKKISGMRGPEVLKDICALSQGEITKYDSWKELNK